MTGILYAIAILMLFGGIWAFTQSRAGTQFPIPIAIGGAALLVILFFR